jgi:hypothetical protein
MFNSRVEQVFGLVYECYPVVGGCTRLKRQNQHQPSPRRPAPANVKYAAQLRAVRIVWVVENRNAVAGRLGRRRGPEEETNSIVSALAVTKRTTG